MGGSLTESIVEDAALEWFGELGYAVGHGPHLAPGEYAGGTLTPALSHGERESYGEVVLVGRLREAIRRLNPAIPEDARATLANSATGQTGRRLKP
jgi:type I restriction enzyme R subunit